MDKLVITGNGPLHGEIHVSGAKNASLPSLCAAILSSGTLELTNLPAVQDIQTMCNLLENLGIGVERHGERVRLNASALTSHQAPYELVKKMRASILVLGPLVGRLGKARVSLPGGCAIGERPVDLHLRALEKMGATITIEHGYIEAEAKQLTGADIHFDKITVTGTENIMMAATLAVGTTVLRNAAREPEVVDLAELLIGMGAQITGHGSETITIQGVRQLHGSQHRIIPDRIETGTFVCAAAITGGHVMVRNTEPKYLTRFLEIMAQAQVPMSIGDDFIEVKPHQGLVSVDVETQPHPGFPTDMQAQFMATMTQATGRSVITESIFENRFMHVAELNRMGANIKTEGRTAITTGPTPLSGAQVMATDLRASASLVVAALVANGDTVIDRIYHLDRGYAELEKKLGGIGALVKRRKS